MASATYYVSRDSRIGNNGSNLGAGASDYLPFGLYSGMQYRTLLYFGINTAGWTSITSATLYVRTSSQYYVAFGSGPTARIQRLTAAFNEGTAVSMSGSNAVVYPGPAATDTNGVTLAMGTAENTLKSANITAMMRDVLGGTFIGVRLIAWTGSAESTLASDVGEIYAREYGSYDAYIVVNYETNRAPTAPTLLSPVGGALTGLTPQMSFNHNDPDGNPVVNWNLQVSTDATFASVTHWNVVAATTNISNPLVSPVYAGVALTRGSTYYWRASTSDGSLTGPWSAAGSFKVNSLPTVTLTSPSGANASVELAKSAGGGNPRMVVRWNYSDPDGGAQAKYRVVVLTDADGAFHDSGTVVSADSSYTVPVDVTRGAFYKVTVTVTDQTGETADSTQTRCYAQWSVTEYKFDSGAVVTAWSASPSSTAGANQSVVVEYASTAGGATPIGTWYSSLASAGLNRWFHFRVWLFCWGGAATPSFTKMTLTYTNSASVPPDGWTITSQHVLDTDTKVYGTQSLKAICNGTALNAYQSIPVEPNTNYVLSGRVKSTGNSGAQIVISSGSSGGAVAVSPAVAATQDWGRVQTPVWNSGANTSVYVRCYANGAAGTAAWYDALKMEASTVVTPWTPGFVSSGVTLDTGGIGVDASAGAVLRLKGSTGGARDTVELKEHGLVFGGDVPLYSDAVNVLRVGLPGQANNQLTVSGGAAASSEGGQIMLEGASGQTSFIIDAYNNQMRVIDMAAGGDVHIAFQHASPQVSISGDLALSSVLTIGGDANLYRAAANILQTDDNLNSGHTLVNSAVLGATSIAFNSANTWYKVAGCEAAFTPAFVGQKWLLLGHLGWQDNSAVATVIDDGALRISADSAGTNPIRWLRVSRHFGSTAANQWNTLEFAKVWVADRTTTTYLHLWMESGSTGHSATIYVGGDGYTTEVQAIPIP